MLTPSPCWTPEEGECSKREVGCRRTCEAWKKWEIIHAEEMQKYKADLYKGNEADQFMNPGNAIKRDRQAYIRQYDKRRRK